MNDPIDLGNPFMCIQSTRLDETADFYRKLGFSLRPDNRPQPTARALRQGPTNLGFLSFVKANSINYRGASVHALVTDLTARGIECHGHNAGVRPVLFQDDDGNPLPDNEAGHFSVYDPDGYHLFFNTHPHERELYENNVWARPHLFGGKLVPDDHMAEELAKGPEGATLGEFIYRLDVRDLAASREFYERMGFAVEDAPDGATDLVGGHPHMLEYPGAFRVRLRQANEPGFTFLFRSDDPSAIAKRVREASILVADAPGGLTITDPNGYELVLVSV